jgi:hypothetical protein
MAASGFFAASFARKQGFGSIVQSYHNGKFKSINPFSCDSFRTTAGGDKQQYQFKVF